MRLILFGLAALAGIVVVSAAEPERPAAAIQDNSFLVEEAYNQEAGVVQHIFTTQFELDQQSGEDDQAWFLAFTQEWPVFSQKHQLSYTVPFSILDGAGGSQNGIGDVFLNYRYQALFESETLPAFAPRFSLILPTGDEDKGLGDGSVGYQFNLPLSKIVHERWTVHANAGLTYFPDIREESSVSYRLGASAIYAASEDLNLMLEWVGDWAETVEEGQGKDREFLAVVSPGLRYALNWETAQLVLGIAAPIGLNRETPEIGAFLYASFEHVFSGSCSE